MEVCVLYDLFIEIQSSLIIVKTHTHIVLLHWPWGKTNKGGYQTEGNCLK